MSSEGVAVLELVLVNKKGLHARAAAKFVKVAGHYTASVVVAKIAGAGVAPGAPPAESSGGSILGLMMLGAECGSKLRLTAKGAQSAEILDGLKALVEERFGEE